MIIVVEVTLEDNNIYLLFSTGDHLNCSNTFNEGFCGFYSREYWGFINAASYDPDFAHTSDVTRCTTPFWLGSAAARSDLLASVVRRWFLLNYVWSSVNWSIKKMRVVGPAAGQKIMVVSWNTCASVQPIEATNSTARMLFLRVSEFVTGNFRIQERYWLAFQLSFLPIHR